jgi:branched-chain amino acid aminotransferase
MTEIAFLNGRFLPKEEAKVSISIPGLLCGFGLFETMRLCNEKVVYFDAHLKRIKNSSALAGMKMAYSPSRLKEIIKHTVKINGFKDAYVRLTLCRGEAGTTTLIIVRKYKPYLPKKYKKGFHAAVSKFRQNDPFFARMKTTSRLFYELGFQEARNKGFDEAIILNNHACLCEATRSNIFFIKDNEIFTPDLECGCLGGVTRQVIFYLAKVYNIKMYEGNFTLEDIYGADEAFLTNSLMGVMPLRVIEKHHIGKSTRSFRLTRFFMRKYNDLLKNGA